jgi:hypothetical protein
MVQVNPPKERQDETDDEKDAEEGSQTAHADILDAIDVPGKSPPLLSPLRDRLECGSSLPLSLTRPKPIPFAARGTRFPPRGSNDGRSFREAREE